MAEPIRVLLVDEDADVVAVTKGFLEREAPALRVDSASSTDAAVDRVASDPVDVVVSDYELPGRTGVEFAADLRERHPDLSVVLYTAHDRSAVGGDLPDPLAGYVRKGTGNEQYAELAALIRDVA